MSILNLFNPKDAVSAANKFQSLSQASSEQAASVEETSASFEQMAASINQNSENAKVTDGMASKASREASDGGVAVKQTVDAMKEIANGIGIIDASEELAATAEEMAGQTEQLQNLMSFFKINNGKATFGHIPANRPKKIEKTKPNLPLSRTHTEGEFDLSKFEQF